MIRIILFSVFVHLCISPLFSQEIQVYSEDFNGEFNIFLLNTAGVGSNTGPNQWIINDEYIGTPLYPNTLRQDSVVSGQINGAPFSKYLHIYDANAAASQSIANANYDPTAASDRFCQFGNAVCTKSLYNVTLTFYYLVEGNENAYGEVYFSKDFGPWVKVGPDKLYNAPKWKRLDIKDTRFDNTQNLRFGFRWINTDNSGPASTSLSIDEINVVADYDEVNHPVSITASNNSDTACRGTFTSIRFELSDTLCEGVYLFELSEPGGSFQNPTSLGTITWQPFFPLAFNINVGMAATLQTGVCYKVRITRVQPAPVIRSNITDCIYVVDCAPVITTNQPPVTIGSGPGGGSGGGAGGLDDGYVLCAGSVIDVPFLSVGTINPDNEYMVILSNKIDTLPGNLVVLVDGDTIGRMPDPNQHPGPPGSVGGMVPNDAEPGCNYYVQVVSTSPPGYGTIYGPFCIRKCDITTNDQQDIHVCIYDTAGVTLTIPVKINTWADSIKYQPGNEFLVQILDAMFFQVVNTGGFGAVYDTAINSIVLDIPDGKTLDSLGIAPGLYYMRIIATNSTGGNDSLGTLVHLTIGRVPSDTTYSVARDSVICRGEQMTFFIVPYDFTTSYEWEFGDGRRFDARGNSFTFNTVGAPADDYYMRVREVNFGCPGPWSPWDTVTILGTPRANIFGLDEICVGDTVQYKSAFFAKTFYEWDAGDVGHLVNTGNNETFMVFDSAGQHGISLFVLNKCGSDFSSKLITVYEKPKADAGHDTTVCTGSEIMREAGPDGMKKYFWLKNSSIVARDSVINLTLTQDEELVLYVEGEAGCGDRDTVQFTVVEPDPPVYDSLTICEGDTATLKAEVPNAKLEWSTGQSTDSIMVAEAGMYSVTINEAGKICPSFKSIEVKLEECEPVFDVPNAFSPNGDGLNDVFKPVGDEVKIVLFEVYDRWGEFIFGTNDFNVGWDGEIRGKPADPGVYTWVLKYKNSLGKVEVKTGNVTLIR